MRITILPPLAQHLTARVVGLPRLRVTLTHDLQLVDHLIGFREGVGNGCGLSGTWLGFAVYTVVILLVLALSCLTSTYMLALDKN